MKIYIGICDDGTVTAKLKACSGGETITHASLGMHKGHRWRMPQNAGIVFWWIIPDIETKHAVQNYLEKRGQKVQLHRVLNDSINATEGDEKEQDFAHGRKA